MIKSEIEREEKKELRRKREDMGRRSPAPHGCKLSPGSQGRGRRGGQADGLLAQAAGHRPAPENKQPKKIQEGNYISSIHGGIFLEGSRVSTKLNEYDP